MNLIFNMKRLIALIALLIIPTSTLAFTSGLDEVLHITEPIVDDYYAVGGEVRINADVTGDLHIAGGTVFVNANVDGDVVLAGGEVQIKGSVTDDVRVIGGNLIIEGTVKDDLVVLAGNVMIQPETVIEGDVAVLGGRVEIWGNVKGNVLSGSEELGIYGVVEGNVKAGSNRIKFGEQGLIKGDLNYIGLADEIEIPKANVEGEIIKGQSALFEVDEDTRQEGFLGLILLKAVSLLSALLLGLLLILIAPNLFKKSAKLALTNSLVSFGIGIAGYGALFILFFVGLLSVIGLQVAGMSVVLFLLLLLINKLFGGFLIGSLIFRSQKSLKKIELFGVLAVGLILVEALKFVPYIGDGVVTVFYFMALGGLMKHCYAVIQELKTKKLI